MQGRRRLGETDRAFVFLCSRPIRGLDEYLPVSLRIFLKKYGVLPAHVTLFHVNQVSVAEAEGGTNFEVINLGRNIVSVSGTYGYMERPDVRGALRELQRRGEIDIPSDRWIIVIGEEDIIIGDDVPFLAGSGCMLFRLSLRLSTPGAPVLRPGLRRRRLEGADPGGVLPRRCPRDPARAGDRRARSAPRALTPASSRPRSRSSGRDRSCQV